MQLGDCHEDGERLFMFCFNLVSKTVKGFAVNVMIL